MRLSDPGTSARPRPLATRLTMLCCSWTSKRISGRKPADRKQPSIASRSVGTTSAGAVIRGSPSRLTIWMDARVAKGCPIGTATQSGSSSSTIVDRSLAGGGGKPMPASTAPERTPSISAMGNISRSRKWIKGWADMKLLAKGGIELCAACIMNPTSTLPCSPALICRAVRQACCNDSRMSLASSRNRIPAGVSRTCRESRSNNVAPNARSNAAIWRLSGGCVMWRRAAARPKWSVSATVRKYRSVFVSIMRQEYRRGWKKALECMDVGR